MTRDEFNKLSGTLAALAQDVETKTAAAMSAKHWREDVPVMMTPGPVPMTTDDRRYLDALYALRLAEAKFRAFQMEFDDKLLAGPPVLER